MRNIIFYFILLFFSSCSAFSKLKIRGEGASSFTVKEIKEIYNQRKKGENKPKFIFLNPVVKSNYNNLGLYEYEITDAKYSFGIKKKVLKSENQLFFNSSNRHSDEEILSQFITKNASNFNQEQIEKLKISFLKGNEVYGNLY